MLLFAGEGRAAILNIPLVKLAPARTVDLKCVSGSYDLMIPIPQRWAIQRAVLKFDYVNSTGILAGKSRMTIKVNGYPVSQINLNPLAPEGSVKLSIPAFLFEPGYNNFSFNISQHYTMECEQPCAEDLWTTLKLDQASIELEYSLKPVPLKLSSTNDFLFDPKISPEGRVNLILENTKPDMVTIAGIIASGIAKRFDYKKVLFSVSNDISQGHDNILVGSSDFAKRFLKSKGADMAEVNKPYIKLMQLPGGSSGSDPNHALIVISGLNSDHLKLAAETLAIMSTSFPNSDEMTPVAFTMPDIPMYGGRLIVTPEKKYTFKNMDFPSYTFKGLHPSTKEIPFRLPADFLIRPNIYAQLSLFYTYGAAMRADSVLNISLNDKLIRSIHLDNSKGDLIEGYKIKIPTYMFKPGDNILRFEPVMTPLIGKNCENLQTDNLFLTIFENSTLYFPSMPHYTELPKIELLMLNGFPITRWPDGHGSTVYLTNNDFNTIGSALNLIGVLTQKNGFPLFEVAFTYKDPKKFDGELIILGDANSIPEDYKKASPLKLTKEMVVPYPVARSWADETSLAYSKQISGFKSGKGALMEFMSPYKDGRTVLLLTAASSEEMYSLSQALTEPAVQAKCEGSLVTVDLSPPDYNVSSLNVGKKYFSGKSGSVSALDRYIYSYPWLYYVAVVLVIISLSLVLFYMLKKYRVRRLKGESEGPRN
ncbi:MAG: cellulose biosynthesis cyclic di-GMP-binding regulatory protein BcsB [Nitrospirae bacterium]|nr:cellulose biosynthesis cyclic di-GMP-binding regulatory protein BcsB [Nitrospirota bacterium]